MEDIKNTAEITVTEEKDMRTILTRVSVFALLAGIPLFMTNKYFNITLSKFLYFALVSVMCFTLSYTFRPEDEVRIKNKENRTMDIAVWGFLLSSVVSALLSSYPADAFLGSSGRCMGVCFVLILTMLYRTVSRYYKIHKTELIGYIGAFSVVMFIAFLQFFGVNVFGLYNNISKATVETYYSTIGNINVVSSYICLCLPFIMYAFCSAKKWWKTGILYILCVAGFCFMVIANSDSGYIGMFAAFCAIVFSMSKKPEKFYRVLILVSAFMFSLRLVRTVNLASGGATKAISPLAIMLGESDAVLICGAVFAVLAVLFAFIRMPKGVFTAVRVLAVAVPVTAAVAVVAAIVYFTCVDTQKELGFFENYLRFSDRWATGRGEIWKMTIDSYSGLPVIKKLFGCGPDTLLPLLSEKYNDRMLVTGYVDNAHNEFMNYLVTHGIIGLGFYLTMLFVSLKKSLKKSQTSPVHGGLFAVVVSYVCQSIVNISQPLTTPFYFIIMFMCCCDFERNATKKHEKEKEIKKL